MNLTSKNYVLIIKKIIGDIGTSNLFKRGGLSLIDQGLLSASNFLVGIILIKTVSQEHYGYWAVIRIFFIFLVSIQNALFITPMNVLYTSKTKESCIEYFNGLFKGQFLFAMFLMFISMICIYPLKSYGIDNEKLLINACVSISCVGYLSREFIRGYYYTNGFVLSVFKIDLIYLSLYFFLLLLSNLTLGLSVYLNFVFIGISASLVSFYCRSELSFESSWLIVKKSFLENWQYGKWALLGVFINHLHHRGYFYLLASIEGSVAVAQLAAAQLFFMPFKLLQGAWSKVALPHGARMREQGKAKQFYIYQWWFTIGMAILVLVYVLILTSFSNTLLSVLFTEKYERSFEYVFLLGLITVMSSVSANASLGLQVILKFRRLTTIHTVVMLMTVTSCFLLMNIYGVKGALSGVLMGYILFSIVLWRELLFD